MLKTVLHCNLAWVSFPKFLIPWNVSKKKKKKEVGTGVVQHKATAGAAVCESQQSF